MSKSLLETFLNAEVKNNQLERCIAVYNTLVFDTNQLASSSCPSSQQVLSSQIDQHCFTSLFASSNAVHQARLLACTMPHANAWIRCLPFQQKKLSCLKWSISIKRWLGCPLFNQDHLCVACNDQIMDVYGHHASVCAVKGDRIKRHNLIRDIISTFAMLLLGLPQKKSCTCSHILQKDL